LLLCRALQPGAINGRLIPDEHWQQMDTVAQLADYVEKRKQLEGSAPTAVKDATSWASVQREFPASQKPIYQDSKNQ
jgi:hypothetical protein